MRFWRQEDISGDVVVRPDGKISLLLLNDIEAAGKTPDQLRELIVAAANQFFEEPHVTVIVKEINSRIVFITGMVAKPGPYPLRGPLTVLQLIATAGGWVGTEVIWAGARLLWTAPSEGVCPADFRSK